MTGRPCRIDSSGPMVVKIVSGGGGGSGSGRPYLLGGLSPIMVASHIAAMTAAACPSRRRRKAERRAWIALGLILAGLAACIILEAFR